MFVPGIMGSALVLPTGKQVWPPEPHEVVLGYKRKEELQRADLRVNDIVRNVSCFDVYEPLIETFANVGFQEKGGGDRLVLFPYDWRRDLEGLSDQLAAKLAEVAAGASSITIVAHSMGGLIARLALERGKFDASGWLKKTDIFMSLATPHLGAPLALARILGLDSAMGISAEDFREIAGNRDYPSGYQLLPAPGEVACWNIKEGQRLEEIDIYDPVAGGRIGLDPQLTARAAWVHQTLANGKQPAHIRYFYFAGTGHKTATRVNVATKEMVVTRSEDAGDGTVPLWSALPVSAQKQLVVGEHASFFTDTNFKAVFYRLFGKPFPKPPIGAAGAPGTAALSVQALTIRATDEIELMIAPAAPVDKVACEVVLERTDRPGGDFAPFGAPVSVSYLGPPIPLLKLRLKPVGTPGFYRISLHGSSVSAMPAQFAATGP
ncbi:hypothetical protein V5F29_05275 [Xanthobacter aminoxidans]|uniref:lipase family alpha/beta hydrolase n=1 Tax=Xanthobacter aminoxidans TaxID=186280 RepID=UPI003729E9B7